MSYWSPDNKVNIGDQVSTVVRSDQSLEYGANNIIKIQISETTAEFIDPKNTYLNFEVKIKNTITGDANCRLSLDHKIGAQALIKNISIYANNNQTLVEEITDYNKYVSILYDYEDNDILRQRRGQMEGTIPLNKNLINNIDNTATEAEYNDVKTNPYYINNDTATFSDADYCKAKVSLRLYTGLFGSDNIIPNALLGGLTVNITLENNVIPFEMVETTNYYQSGESYKRGLQFYGVDNTGANWADASASSEFFCKATTNNMLTLDNLPIRVGSRINLTKSDKSTLAQFETAAPVDQQLKVKSLSIVNNNATDEKLVRIELSEAMTLKSGGAIDNTYFVYDIVSTEATALTPIYTISNVDLVVQSVKLKSNIEAMIMKAMNEQGKFVYDINSIQNYRYSALKSDTVLNMRLPIQNSRCFSILSMPTDTTNYSALSKVSASDTYAISTGEHSTRSGLVGIYDGMRDYQYFYEKNQPQRPINVSKMSTPAVVGTHLLGIENGLRSANIMPLSLSKHKKNFILGRQFAKNGGVYDARNKDFNIMCNYDNIGTKDKLWVNFVAHNRKIMISKDGSIQVSI